MAGDILHAGIRFNGPTAKYAKFEYDTETLELDIYLTALIEGTETMIKGTVSKWVPVVQEG